MTEDQAYNISSKPWCKLQEFYPKIISPTVPLTPELMELHTFLLNQKPNTEVDAAYISMNKKEMEAKMRELENWNFRLYLDEGKEIRRGQQLKVLTGEFPVPISGGVNGSSSVAASKEAATHEISTRTSAKRPRRM
ncbi:hypothetical protein H310_05088 [Aphanomyces invadans]|uniref:Uncharacterized protein n=1 Tax=Aphanomyces invadans TaxID=157072 RepID=A0A024UBX2_9STRA|nr:hypothetical protein H310_05088 [Aphanomyces invadans]ETW03705.1 hypothetical protein H310_05088 [Aphanomyces invadans]|eukprot:XP_008867934.1 hypothetical protein H310_05088 [Aphanomyces invadans]